MTWPQATRKDHHTFCQVEQWLQVRDSRGRTGMHHVTFTLVLPDGRTLRTRISHPPGRTDYGPKLWRHILRDQLEVDEPTFWACAQDRIKPQRGAPEPSKESLPADLVHLLILRVGLPEDQVAEMSKEDAIARIQQFWSEGH
ncbi:MAG TPA: cytotoxic translational repressor of toxin-antitoxin stability system [Pseudonocardiaceae bacterium]